MKRGREGEEDDMKCCVFVTNQGFHEGVMLMYCL